MPNLNDKQKTEYWIKRAEQRLINAENLTSDMLEELRKTYAATITQLEKEINAFYGKYVTETGLDITEVRKRLNPKELKSFKEQLNRYYSEVKRLGGYAPDTKLYLRELSAKAYISRLEELQAQMRWQVENLYRTQQLKLFDVLSKGYEDTYLRATFDMQQGIGFAYSFSTLDDRKVRLAVTQKWQGSNFSDRIWADKARLIDTLNTAIPQGVALGQNPRKVAQTIAKSMNTRYSNAERLARTEMGHIANQATMEAYKSVPEVLQKYKYVATLDSRVSEICASLDGKIFNMNEAEEGVNYPEMHPNCFDRLTQVMTNNGFKYFIDLKTDDKVLTLNPETLETEYQKPIAYYRYRYSGFMLLFEDENTNIKVTPEHNMFESGKLKKALLCEKIYQDTGKLEFINDFNKKYEFNGLIKQVKYDDDVFCVEVEKYNTLLVKRKNKYTWAGNCRSTTVPYFEELENSQYTRIATDYSKNGQPYYVPANLSYTEWKNSLSEEQQKFFIADKKAREQYKSDVKQAQEYRKLVTKANKSGYGELFEGYKFDTKSLQELKYLNPDEYETVKSNMRIIKNL